MDHWRLGTQNVVKQATLTSEEEAATIKDLEAMPKDDPMFRFTAAALQRHQRL